jgi:rRNA-processing protein FCF1
MRLLFDLDIIIHTSLHATKDSRFLVQVREADNWVESILEQFNPSDYKFAVSGSNNFRKLISNSYKANRKAEDRPRYLFDVKRYFIKYREAEEAEGEADDLIASWAESGDIIVSSDKDFKQLGITMYNPCSNKLIEIDNPWYWWWQQMLTGDKVDNVEGLKNPDKLHWKSPPNFTPDTADEVLKDKSKDEMKDTVVGLYQAVHGDGWFEHFDRAAQLLWLRREPDKTYLDYI